MIVTEAKRKLHLFEGFGVELEYMIVKRDSLSVAPISDALIYAVASEYISEVELGDIAWSNELVLHVIELKTNGPSKSLRNLAIRFQEHINKINTLLAPHNAMLLPTGAHPFMDPHKETRIWPHEYNAVYHSYNKIFDCQGHGWANVQSSHLNLPFNGEHEFVQLHSAIRLLLPIIPALSASTPLLEGKKTPFLDTRLEFYRKNQQKIPSIAGVIVPEAITSFSEYHERILNPMYKAIAEFDEQCILQAEWLNSRGAIARFDRDAIEIRIIDTQECPQSDIAIFQLLATTLKAMIHEQWLTLNEQLDYDETVLADIFLAVIKHGQTTIINNPDYLRIFGLKQAHCTVKDVWEHIVTVLSKNCSLDNETLEIIEKILHHGNLAERINASLANNFSLGNIATVYNKLAHCLQHGEFYVPALNNTHAN